MWAWVPLGPTSLGDWKRISDFFVFQSSSMCLWNIHCWGFAAQCLFPLFPHQQQHDYSSGTLLVQSAWNRTDSLFRIEGCVWLLAVYCCATNDLKTWWLKIIIGLFHMILVVLEFQSCLMERFLLRVHSSEGLGRAARILIHIVVKLLLLPVVKKPQLCTKSCLRAWEIVQRIRHMPYTQLTRI